MNNFIAAACVFGFLNFSFCMYVRRTIILLLRLVFWFLEFLFLYVRRLIVIIECTYEKYFCLSFTYIDRNI